MSKRRFVKRAYLSDVALDDVLTRHIEQVTTPMVQKVWVGTEAPTEGDENEDNYREIVLQKGKQVPRRAILVHKYKFLIHDIIMRCRASKNNSVQMNCARYVSVLGKVFTDMLYTLADMHIITLDLQYILGECSRHVSLNDWNIDFVDDENPQVVYYLDKLKKTFLASVMEYARKDDNSGFIKKYNECLSRLELRDKDKALDYVEKRRPSFESEHSYHYYKSRIEDFNKKELVVSSVDKNNRIYHYLTNMPKSLKRFFNIKYQCDIANSHPVLFSYYLIKEYNINKDIITFLSNLNYKDISLYHNDGKQLRKLLKDNGVEVPCVKSLPTDVLQYILATMKGRFWDDFVKIIKTMDRGEVKSTLFREVFYSHSTTTRNRPYAKQFAEIYPNVWHTIRMMKKEAREALPNRMMSLESGLFGSILRQCYSRGWCVVSIHDAIVVLDVSDNEHLEVEDLTKVIMTEYARYGLYPTIAVDEF